MPNWVHNIIQFNEKDCSEEKFVEICKKITDRKGEIDFNKIKPMPKSVKNTTSGFSHGLGEVEKAACYLINKGIPQEAEEIIIGRGIARQSSSVNQAMNDIENFLKTATEEEREEVCAEGKKYYTNIIKYGVIDWYEWAIENWGTKWNGSNTNTLDEKREIHFDTPWSAPGPVLAALSEMFPDIEIMLKYADEDVGGGNNGIIIFEEGKITGEDYDLGDEFAAVEVWGYNSVKEYYGEDEEDEEDEEAQEGEE